MPNLYFWWFYVPNLCHPNHHYCTINYFWCTVQNKAKWAQIGLLLYGSKTHRSTVCKTIHLPSYLIQMRFDWKNQNLTKTNTNKGQHRHGNNAKSSNVPLYLKKIKMSFNHPPRPNKGSHLQSVHTLFRIDVYCRRKGWCCLYKEKSLSCWALFTHS